MNRRNFLLGVGTATILSGAASVAGAALSNTVSTSFGGFQVVATEALNVRRNGALDSDTLESEGNFSNDTIDFTAIGQDSPVDYTDFPQLFVNNESDGNLIIELATSADETAPYNTNLSEGGSEPYNGTQSYGYAPIVIENTGTKQKTVAMEYTYGSGVGGDLSKAQVADLYQFHIDTTQVSPLPGDPTAEGNSVTIDGGQTKLVNLNINLTEATARDIQTVAGSLGAYNFTQASRERADILDTATFGTT
jgi:hypothetical protein